MKDAMSILRALGPRMILFVPGVLANVIAFYCVIPDLRREQTIVKWLLLLLSSTDMSGCLGLVLLRIVNQFEEIPLGFCSFSSFFTVFPTLASGSVATYMAVERCMALRAPYWYKVNMFRWFIWAPLVCICVCTVLVCFLPEMGLGVSIFTKNSSNESYLVCGPLPRDISPEVETKDVFTVTFATFGLILVLVTISCNVAVLCSLRKMIKAINPAIKKTSDASHEFEMTKMLLCLSTTFLICWVPFNIDLICRQLMVEMNSTVTMITHILLGINFVVDPIIYLTMKRKYRQKVFGICCKKLTNVRNCEPRQGVGIQDDNV